MSGVVAPKLLRPDESISEFLSIMHRIRFLRDNGFIFRLSIKKETIAPDDCIAADVHGLGFVLFDGFGESKFLRDRLSVLFNTAKPWQFQYNCSASHSGRSARNPW